MNKIYKVVWNAVRNCYVVASEFASGKESFGAFRSSFVNQMARYALQSALVVMACLLTLGFVPEMNEHVYAAAQTGVSSENHQYVLISTGGNLEGTNNWNYVFVTDNNGVLYTTTNGAYGDGTTGGTLDASTGVITNGNTVHVGTRNMSNGAWSYDSKNYQFTSYKNGVYTLTAADGSTIHAYKYGKSTLTAPDNKTYGPYRIRDGYTVTMEEQGKYHPNATTNMVYDVTYTGDPADKPTDILEKVDHLVSLSGTTTNLNEHLQTATASTYTSAASGGSLVESGWDYYLNDNGTYHNIKGNSSRFVTTDNARLKWNENLKQYTFDGTPVSNDNLYVVGGKLGVFTTEDGRSVYTGQVYGSGNELLLTTTRDGKYYSFWGAKSIDPTQTMSDYPVSKYNSDIQTLTNNDTKLAHNDINKVTVVAGNTNATITMYRNGTDMQGNSSQVSGQITLQAGGGENGIGRSPGANDRTLSISANSDGSSTKTFNMGSRVGVRNDLTGNNLHSLTINGTTYGLLMNYAGDDNSTVTKNLSDTLSITGGATNSNNLTTGNIGVVNSGTAANGALSVRLNKDVNLTDNGSLTVGKTKVTNDGVKVTNSTADSTQNPSVTSSGINAGSKVITNVASGGNASGSTNAANIADVHKIAKEDVTLAQGKNITVTPSDTGEVRTYGISLNDNVTLHGDTTAAHAINLDGNAGTITIGDGTDAANRINFNGTTGVATIGGITIGNTTVSGTTGNINAILGLENKTWNPKNGIVSGRAATEDQLSSAMPHYFSISKSQNGSDANEEYGNYWNDGAKGDHAVAIGHNVTAAGEHSIAIGDGGKDPSTQTTAKGNETLAIGYQTTAEGDRSIAVGNNNKANGIRSVSIGMDVQAGYASNAANVNSDNYEAGTMDGGADIAVGNRTRVYGTGSTAIGFGAKVGDSTITTSGNTVTETMSQTADMAMALGGRSQALQDGSVALGNLSYANRKAGSVGTNAAAGDTATEVYLAPDDVKSGDVDMGTLKATIENGTVTKEGSTDNLKAGTAWRGNMGAVSIGSDARTGTTASGHTYTLPKITRQLTGLAAGSQDTDAVNVAQLKALAALGTNYQGQNLEDGTTTLEKAHVDQGGTLTIQGGANSTANTIGNIYVAADKDNHSMTVSLKDDVNLHTLTAGTAGTVGTTDNPGTGRSGKVSIVGQNGSDYVAYDITAGRGTNDLKADANAAANTTGRLSYTENGTTHTLATLEDGLKFTGDDAKEDGTNHVVRKLADQTMSLKGGANPEELSDNNIGVVSNKDNNGLEVKLAKNVDNLTTVTAGDKTDGKTGVKMGSQTASVANPTTESGNQETGNYVTGLDNKDWTVGQQNHVSGRAATEDQLKAVSDQTKKNQDNIEKGWNAVVDNGSGTNTTVNVNPDKNNLNIKQGKNVALTADAADNSITVATQPNVEFNQVTVRDTDATTGGVTIGKQADGNDSSKTGYYATGLDNKTWDVGTTKAVSGRAATEDQLQAVSDTANTNKNDITELKKGWNLAVNDGTGDDVAKAVQTGDTVTIDNKQSAVNANNIKISRTTNDNGDQTVSLGLNKDITLGSTTGNTEGNRVGGSLTVNAGAENSRVTIDGNSVKVLTGTGDALANERVSLGYDTSDGGYITLGGGGTGNSGHMRLFKNTDSDATGIARLAYVDPESDMNPSDYHTLATLDDGTTYAGDTGTDTKVALNHKVTVTGAASATDNADATKWTTGNLSVGTEATTTDGSADGNAKMTIKLKKDLDGISSVGQNGNTINFGDTANGGITLKGGDVSVDSHKITNVANGTNDNDAVNLSQLNSVKTTAEKGWVAKVDGVTDKDITVNPDNNTLTYKAGSNIAITPDAANRTIAIGTNPNVYFNSVRVAENAATTGGILIGKQQGGGANPNEDYYVTGLKNTTWTNGSIVSGRAATEDQLQAVANDIKSGTVAGDVYITGGSASYKADTETDAGTGTISVQRNNRTDAVTINGLHDYYIKDAKLDNNHLVITRNDDTTTAEGTHTAQWSVDLSGLVTPDYHLVGSGDNQDQAYTIDTNGDVTLKVTTDGTAANTKEIKISGLAKKDAGLNFGANSSNNYTSATDKNADGTRKVALGNSIKVIGSAAQANHTYADNNITTELDKDGNIHILMDANPTIQSVTFKQGDNATTLNLANEGDKLYYTKNNETTKNYIATTDNGLTFQGNNSEVNISKKLNDEKALSIVGDATDSTAVAKGNNIYVTGSDADGGSLKIQLNKDISGLNTVKVGSTEAPITIGTQANGTAATETGNYITGLSNTNWTNGNIVNNRAATEAQLKAVQDADKYVSAMTVQDDDTNKGKLKGTLTVANGTNVDVSGLHDYYVTSGKVENNKLTLTRNDGTTVPEIDLSGIISKDTVLGGAAVTTGTGTEAKTTYTGDYQLDTNGDLTLNLVDAKDNTKREGTVKITGLAAKATVDQGMIFGADNTTETENYHKVALGGIQKILGKDTTKGTNPSYENGNISSTVDNDGNIVISLNDNPTLKSLILQGTGTDTGTITLTKGTGDNQERLHYTVGSTDETVANLSDGLTFTGNMGSVTKKLNTSLPVIGKDTDNDNSHKNITVAAEDDGLKLQLNEDVHITNLRAGNTANNTTGSISIVGKDKTNGTLETKITSGYDAENSHMPAAKASTNGDNISRLQYQTGAWTTHTVATLEDGMNLTGDVTKDGDSNADKVGIGLNRQVSLKGGATAADNLTSASDKNIGVNVTKDKDGNAEINLLLNKNLSGLETVTAGKAKLGTQEATYTINNGTGTKETGSYVTGLDNITWDPANKGIVSGRAATEDQLKIVADSLNQTIAGGKFGLKADNGSEVTQNLNKTIAIGGSTVTLPAEKEVVMTRSGVSSVPTQEHTDKTKQNIVTSVSDGKLNLNLANQLVLGQEKTDTTEAAEGRIDLYGGNANGDAHDQNRIHISTKDGITLRHTDDQHTTEQKDGISIMGPFDNYLYDKDGKLITDANGNRANYLDSNGTIAITNNEGQFTARLADVGATGFLGLGNTVSTMESNPVINKQEQIRTVTTTVKDAEGNETSKDVEQKVARIAMYTHYGTASLNPDANVKESANDTISLGKDGNVTTVDYSDIGGRYAGKGAMTRLKYLDEDGFNDNGTTTGRASHTLATMDDGLNIATDIDGTFASNQEVKDKTTNGTDYEKASAKYTPEAGSRSVMMNKKITITGNTENKDMGNFVSAYGNIGTMITTSTDENTGEVTGANVTLELSKNLKGFNTVQIGGVVNSTTDNTTSATSQDTIRIGNLANGEATSGRVALTAANFSNLRNQMDTDGNMKTSGPRLYEAKGADGKTYYTSDTTDKNLAKQYSDGTKYVRLKDGEPAPAGKRLYNISVNNELSTARQNKEDLSKMTVYHVTANGADYYTTDASAGGTTATTSLNPEYGRYMEGLSNTNWNGIAIDSDRAATEGQLQEAQQQVSTYHAYDNTNQLGGGFALADDSGTNVTQNLGTAIAIKGDSTVDENGASAKDGNILTTADNNGKSIKVSLNRNLNVDSVTTGNTKLDKSGVTVTNSTDNSKVALTENGLDNGNHKITNIANGVNDHDAVNMSQLKNVETTAGQHTEVTVNGDNVAPSDGTYTTAGNLRLKKTKAADGKDVYDVKLADDVNVKTVTTGDKTNNAKLDANGLVITDKSGGTDKKVEITSSKVDFGGNKIQNIASGETGKVWNDSNYGQNWTDDQKKNANNAANMGDVYSIAKSEAAKAANTVSGSDNITVTKSGDKPNDYKVSLNNDVTLGEKGTAENPGKAGSLQLTDGKGNNTIHLDGKTGVIATGDVQMSKDGIKAGDKQITNVASGLNGKALKDIKEGDAEYSNAANIGDLQKATSEINNNITEVNNTVAKGLNFQGDDKADVNRKLGDTLKLNGGQTDKDKLIKDEKNIGIVRNDAGDGLDVRLAKDIKGLDSLSVKDTTIDDKGVTVANKDKDGKETGTTTVLNGSGTTVTNTSKDKDGNQFTTTTNYGDGGMTISTSVTTSGGQKVNLAPVQVSQTNVTMGGNQVHNVASGYSGQMYQGNPILNNAASIGDLEARSTQITNQLGGAINKLDNRIDKVGAGAAALAGLHPQDFDPEDKWDIAAGYGHYRSANAMAVGAFYRPDEYTMFNIGGSFGGGENLINAGLTIKLGRRDKDGLVLSRVAMAEQIRDLKATIEMQNAKIAKSDELEAKVAKQDQEIAELKAMVKALAAKQS